MRMVDAEASRSNRTEDAERARASEELASGAHDLSRGASPDRTHPGSRWRRRAMVLPGSSHRYRPVAWTWRVAYSMCSPPSTPMPPAYRFVCWLGDSWGRCTRVDVARRQRSYGFATPDRAILVGLP